MQQLYAVVLAAGKGTRMKSKKHKVLHPVCGKPIIDHIVGQLRELDTAKTILIVGHLAESLKDHLGEQVLFAEQEEQLGTAHAVMQAKPLLEKEPGVTLVLNGDHPLFTKETLAKMVEKHRSSGAAATVLTALLDDPTGYGRVIRRTDGSVDRIVEHKDASEEERAVHEINTGTFCFDNQKLFAALALVNNDNVQGEYYLPDVISILKEQGEQISAEVISDSNEAMGINDRIQLAEAEALMRQRILRQHMVNGVSIVDPANTYIEADVTIGPDTIIEPGTILRGKTQIGEGCHIGPQADLTDVTVADNVRIKYAVIDSSQVDESATVGPYAYLRPGTRLGPETKVGCFVDLKKARLGKGAKVSHLAYVGDAEVGEKVNIGCGAVTVNYDGKNKHKTVIGDGAFIGCNVNLVAPVEVKEGAYVAAGSTITDDVPEDALAIARQRQTTKPDYVKKWLENRSK
ncbi:bifunctional UDP-N-acetylglucosamine diphosphorylase/glucosamine-1-phosphate N-acetyltransferase GlmU [Paenactinomyces guangxiensis]|uniref:Bifunctional protein GlmU n=1 Tax=Paenactinomyces guangxiensis TaxID=1490290 RepID=A0A7W1WTR5_9BACL|nr:bifunctional UDP-N-acetylglucosamine diphosphorylase/glucosamine-1-phosphate N-acetyltransferase GlmU [Paenactinomyces guangxiensis]MBA4495822.1 bifunctional UDP-N-acetylglucosamine diphosphorylase/glucosamine-1-phosphate N-acetyltransferase GlmU [Paenactinomyces guangxiensis]MBH8592912.1 bifunctional UDP-N-acetylglucosamine diphosphorylase/glucosamine-1-phosphate N-acetyltransferase GlmU [Paenactinomyces guangxiensis]